MTTEGTRRGLLVVVSAPSGAGKTTVIRELLGEMPNVKLSVSMTTRPPRPGEQDGIDYRFVDEATFDRTIAASGFAEWAHVHDHRYGTPVDFLDAETAAGHDVLLDIDVQGAFAIRKRYPHAVLVFLAPPSFDELERRLRARGTEKTDVVDRRLARGRREMEERHRYDFVVVNERVSDAVVVLRAVVVAERHRTGRD